MTNPLTQDELIEIAVQAGFESGEFPDGTMFIRHGSRLVHKSLAKFAQLIQQRQGEAIESVGWRFRKLDPDNGWRSPWKIADDETDLEILKKVSLERSGHIIEVEHLYTAPPTASQLVAQALEKAAGIVEKYTHDELNGKNTAALIRALIAQPVDHIEESLDMVEQGGDELAEACEELISQYEAVPEFTMGGKLTNGPFIKIREALANRRGGE